MLFKTERVQRKFWNIAADFIGANGSEHVYSLPKAINIKTTVVFLNIPFLQLICTVHVSYGAIK